MTLLERRIGCLIGLFAVAVAIGVLVSNVYDGFEWGSWIGLFVIGFGLGLAMLYYCRPRRPGPRQLWRHPRKAAVPESRLQVGDVVRRLNGELLYVVKLEWPSGRPDGAAVTLDPLADVLARSLLVHDPSHASGMSLHDALLLAGWQPPEPDLKEDP